MLPSANIEEELGEALSRASVLKSLDSAYAHTTTPGKKTDSTYKGDGKGSHSKGAGSKHNTPKLAVNQSNSNDEVVAMMQALIEDNSNKTGKFFMDQIKGKSIILENVKAQTQATKYVEKEKRYIVPYTLYTSCYCLEQNDNFLLFCVLSYCDVLIMLPADA